MSLFISLSHVALKQEVGYPYFCVMDIVCVMLIVALYVAVYLVYSLVST